MRYKTLFILALALLLPLGFGCDNDNSSNAQPPPGGAEPMGMTKTVGTVDAAGEGCMGIDGLEVGDFVVLEITITDTEKGNVTLTNFNTGEKAECDDGFIQQEKNKLASNILCDGIKDSNIEGLPDNDILEVGITFETLTNRLLIINGMTKDCVNVTMANLSSS